MLQFIILQVFDGNVNPYEVKKNTLKHEVASKVVRFSYLSAKYYNILPCIRAEIFGFREIEPGGKSLMARIERKYLCLAWLFYIFILLHI